ncbi:mucin-16-like isoform X2 [Monodelphis domestica]|uniref:mucin-16-like isoform X2 n=1 Tax=Monodelphis domestica TaxID=13616 RepID=UPI0024E1D964|nr:mucin-16-like isoform X2 [Monodelphis domestica]
MGAMCTHMHRKKKKAELNRRLASGRKKFDTSLPDGTIAPSDDSSVSTMTANNTSGYKHQMSFPCFTNISWSSCYKTFKLSFTITNMFYTTKMNQKDTRTFKAAEHILQILLKVLFGSSKLGSQYCGCSGLSLRSLKNSIATGVDILCTFKKDSSNLVLDKKVVSWELTEQLCRRELKHLVIDNDSLIVNGYQHKLPGIRSTKRSEVGIGPVTHIPDHGEPGKIMTSLTSGLLIRESPVNAIESDIGVGPFTHIPEHGAPGDMTSVTSESTVCAMGFSTETSGTLKKVSGSDQGREPTNSTSIPMTGFIGRDSIDDTEKDICVMETTPRATATQDLLLTVPTGEGDLIPGMHRRTVSSPTETSVPSEISSGVTIAIARTSLSMTPVEITARSGYSAPLNISLSRRTASLEPATSLEDPRPAGLTPETERNPQATPTPAITLPPASTQEVCTTASPSPPDTTTEGSSVQAGTASVSDQVPSTSSLFPRGDAGVLPVTHAQGHDAPGSTVAPISSPLTPVSTIIPSAGRYNWKSFTLNFTITNMFYTTKMAQRDSSTFRLPEFFLQRLVRLNPSTPLFLLASMLPSSSLGIQTSSSQVLRSSLLSFCFQFKVLFERSSLGSQYCGCNVTLLRSMKNGAATGVEVICFYKEVFSVPILDKKKIYQELSQETNGITRLGHYILDKKSLYVDGYNPQMPPRSTKESVYHHGTRRWRKLYRMNGHLFQSKRFNRRAYCGQCSERLWCLGRQGYKCIDCKLLVHKGCHILVSQTCKRHMDLVMPSQEPQVEDKNDKVDLPSEENDGLAYVPSTWKHDSLKDDSGDIKPVIDGMDGIKISQGLGLQDFDLIRVIGRGSYAKVLLVRLKKNDQIYAMKVVKKKFVHDHENTNWVQTEKHVFEQASSNPFLVGLHSCFQTRSHLFLVIEYVNGGDLLFHMQRKNKLPEEHTRFYAAEICIALNFLHERGIIYRDLKLDNILLDTEGHIKLTDYGICKEGLGPGDTTRTFCGTPNYIAPEILRGEEYGFSVDWWALGVLMFEMMVGRSPFDIITDKLDMATEDDLFQVILEKPIQIPRFLSVKASRVLKGFLNKDPKGRLGCQPQTGFSDIKSHMFFRSIDWDLLEKKQALPPFQPQITDDYGLDNFDTQFTSEPVQLTPDDENVIKRIDQSEFEGFEYINPLLLSTEESV